jgi:uncharacterized protein (TIGR02246 family)
MARLRVRGLPAAWWLGTVSFLWAIGLTAPVRLGGSGPGGGAAFVQPRATAAQSSDDPFLAVATAWQDAWNRHDMDALADVVAEDVDFITIGGRKLKGRAAFKTHHARVHAAPVFNEAVVEIRATHVQRLSPEVVLMHVEHGGRGDRNPDGTPRASRGNGIFTWILTPSGGRWRVRASCNTLPGTVPDPSAAQPLYGLTPPAQPAPTASADAPFVAIASAWTDAWNRHDMEALADIVTEDVDFVSVGLPWLKGRAAFKQQVTQLHATLFEKVEVRGAHVQRLASEVVLMHVEWTTPGERNAGGTLGLPGRDGIFTWILTRSGGRWRLRAATNTVITLPQAQPQ